jgi:hypothetical protein
MSLDEFLKIKTALRACPICTKRLHGHEANSAVRMCPDHGTVFSIMTTTKGYHVEVKLPDNIRVGTCVFNRAPHVLDDECQRIENAT